MSVTQVTERYFYPSNPHTKTNAEVGGTTEPHSWFQSAPGIAPILTFPIENDHPIAPRWGDFCGQIIDKLKTEEIRFVAIECFRRRQQSRKTDDIPDDATVVITVKDFPPMTDSLRGKLHDIHVLSGMFSFHIAMLLTSTNTTDQGVYLSNSPVAKFGRKGDDSGAFAMDQTVTAVIGILWDGRTVSDTTYLFSFNCGCRKISSRSQDTMFVCRVGNTFAASFDSVFFHCFLFSSLACFNFNE